MDERGDRGPPSGPQGTGQGEIAKEGEWRTASAVLPAWRVSWDCSEDGEGEGRRACIPPCSTHGAQREVAGEADRTGLKEEGENKGKRGFTLGEKITCPVTRGQGAQGGRYGHLATSYEQKIPDPFPHGQVEAEAVMGVSAPRQAGPLRGLPQLHHQDDDAPADVQAPTHTADPTEAGGRGKRQTDRHAADQWRRARPRLPPV